MTNATTRSVAVAAAVVVVVVVVVAAVAAVAVVAVAAVAAVAATRARKQQTAGHFYTSMTNAIISTVGKAGRWVKLLDS